MSSPVAVLKGVDLTYAFCEFDLEQIEPIAGYQVIFARFPWRCGSNARPDCAVSIET